MRHTLLALAADLLKFENASTVKEVYHYTSYFLLAGVPTALLLGAPVTSVLDAAMGVAIPLHFHIGMRSVLVDYVHEPAQQSAALAVLAGVTVLTALGLTKLNTTDVGLTEAVKSLWVTQDAPSSVKSAAPKNPF